MTDNSKIEMGPNWTKKKEPKPKRRIKAGSQKLRNRKQKRLGPKRLEPKRLRKCFICGVYVDATKHAGTHRLRRQVKTTPYQKSLYNRPPRGDDDIVIFQGGGFDTNRRRH